jgi:hypothetical protein
MDIKSIEGQYRKAMEAEPFTGCAGLGFIEIRHEFGFERLPCQNCGG